MKRFRILVSLLLIAATLFLTACSGLPDLFEGVLTTNEDRSDAPAKDGTSDAGNQTEATAEGSGSTEVTGTVTAEEITTGENTPSPTPGELNVLPKAAFYGYGTLVRKDRPELTALYDMIADAVENRREEIDLSATELTVTREDLDTVFSCYCIDFPQHFWRENTYSCRYVTEPEKVTSVGFVYSVDAGSLPEMQEAFFLAADTMLKGIADLETDYERELAIHDRIINAAHYDTTYEAPLTHTAYGNLVNHTSVCDGYAKLFQYLLARCGILSFPVSGVATSASGSENHAWNVVLIDGDYYLTDVTWDDPVGGSETLTHEYFNRTSAVFAADHTPADDLAYEIPNCTATEAEYYTRKASRAELTVASIAAVLARQTADGDDPAAPHEILLNTPTTRTDFSRFLNADVPGFFAAAEEALGVPVSGISYTLSTNGQVLTLTFNIQTK